VTNEWEGIGQEAVSAKFNLGTLFRKFLPEEIDKNQENADSDALCSQ
jgi:hypothetical protein